MLLKEKILIIDDCSSELIKLTDKISTEYEVTTSTNPTTVVALIKKLKPVAIILDIYMPFLDGFEILGRIKNTPELQHYPVLMVSHDDDLKTIDRCFQNGASDFLMRKMSAGQILSRIKRCAQKRELNLLKPSLFKVCQIKQTVEINQQEISLTPNEYKILFMLSREDDYSLKKENLIELIWGGTSVIDKTLNTHLTNLRKKISPYGLLLSLNRKGIVSLNVATKA